MKFELEIKYEEIREEFIKVLAKQLVYSIPYETQKAVEASLKIIDQAQISRLVTRILVEEHIKEMRNNEL